jgi:hypothetical protein
MAVLDEGGSRLGFVPYDSLSYVVPAGEAETGTAMTVRATDGSEFSCAAISQTSAGVAALNTSGARVGFVPYDTLQYVLPESKAGASLDCDCTLPAGIAAADEAGADPERDTDDEVTEERDTDDEATDEESGGVWEDAADEAEQTEGDAEPAEEEDGLWEDAEESTEPVDPEAPVVEEEGEATADASAEAEADADADAAGDSQRAERETAGESEMQVEWSFGEYDE